MKKVLVDEKAIFKVACCIDSPEVRRDYLSQVCGNDAALFERVATLLRMHEEEPEFLESPPNPRACSVANEAATMAARSEAATVLGSQIGPYKLREQIGEGGFGVVYVAEQQEPVSRKVALKIIKPGMDTRDVIARFEAERQALALMDHPSVAKVLDAGATDTGRPYFVMELVRGLPITTFCDDQKLTTRERLELFVGICRAVQHAHQKGIIHRDLKPSNVMITMHDNKAMPKVIDFGVSKALSRKLTDKTVYTAYDQMVGTPLYMSPEQAQMSGLDIDTRSDVYSLGVLLYELLTATTPFDKETLKNVGFDELRRIIREDEPPRPSARVSTLNAEALSTVSDNRKVEPAKLGRSYRGELDWIVMKALEKDRNRRYESASAFAADVERYLSDETVQACPPSAWYLLRKHVRKNRTAASIVFLTTLAVVAVAVSGFVVAGRTGELAERQRQTAQKRIDVNQQLNDALAAAEKAKVRAENSAVHAEQLWGDARRAAERAKVLADNELADENLQRRAVLLHAETKAGEQDYQLVAELKRIGATTFAEPERSRSTDERGGPALVAYRTVLARNGIDPSKTSTVAMIKWMQDRPEPVRAALVAAFEHWVSYYDAVPLVAVKEVHWLNDVLDAVDTNSWRMRLRRAIRNADTEELIRLSRSREVAHQPPHALFRLGRLLLKSNVTHISKFGRAPFHGSPRDGMALLKRAQLLHPGDFSINFYLASSEPYFQARYDEEQRTILTPTAAEKLAEWRIRVRYASAAVAIRPDDYRARTRLADALRFSGEKQAAIAAYERSVELSSQIVDYSHENLVYAYLDTKQAEKAMALLKEISRRVRDDPAKTSPIAAERCVRLRWIGGAFESHQQIDAAIDAYRAAFECWQRRVNLFCRTPDYPVSLTWESGHADEIPYPLLRLLESQGRLEEAVPILKEARQKAPGGRHALNRMLVQIYLKKQRWKDIVDLLSPMVKSGRLGNEHASFDVPNKGGKTKDELREYGLREKARNNGEIYWWYHAELARALVELGRTREAVEPARAALKRWQADMSSGVASSLVNGRGALHRDWNAHKDHPGIIGLFEIKPIIKSFVEVLPREPAAHYSLGVVHSVQSEHWMLTSGSKEFREQAERHRPLAIAAYRRALSLDPKFVPALIALAELEERNALDLYGEAVKLQPKQARLWHKYADALIKAGKAGEALDAWRKHLQLTPQHEWDSILRDAGSFASGLYKLGHPQLAVTFCRDISRLAPRRLEPWEQLAATRLTCGDEKGYRETCSELLERYLNLENQPFPRWRIAEICTLAPIGAADLNRVESLARKSIDLHQHDPRAHHALGRVLYRAGRFVEAAAVLERAGKLRRRTVFDDLVWQAMAAFKTGRPDQAFDWIKKTGARKAGPGRQGIILKEARVLLGLPPRDSGKKP